VYFICSNNKEDGMTETILCLMGFALGVVNIVVIIHEYREIRKQQLRWEATKETYKVDEWDLPDKKRPEKDDDRENSFFR
jgi:hypothetical protein